MKIYLTNELSEALLKLPREEIDRFIDSVDRIKDLNKTEILNLDKTVELFKENGVSFYAYNLFESTYVLFSFKPKKTMVLLDVIELDNDELTFMVYTELSTSKNKSESE